jgi:hypothetical protein
MDNIRLEAGMKDDATPVVRKLAAEIGDLGEKTQATGKKAGKSWDDMGDKAEKSASRTHKAMGRLKDMMTGFGAQMAAAAGAAGFGMLIKSGLQYNSTLETLSMQFKVLTGSAEKANQVMGALVTFAAKTPFELGEVANAERILMAFGLHGATALRRAGDAAAAANRPLEEVAMTLGRIKAGAFGEAFMRLAEMGLATREMLEGKGLKFDKGGSYVGSVGEALAGINAIIDERFTGMMETLAGTFQGKMSTLADTWKGFLGALTRALWDRLKPRIDQLTNALQGLVDSGTADAIGRFLARPLDAVAGLIIRMVENAPKIFLGMVNGITRVLGFFRSLVAGFNWLRDVVVALKDVIVNAFAVASLSIERAFARMGDWTGGKAETKAIEVKLKGAKEDLEWFVMALQDAWGQSGLRAKLREETANFRGAALGRGTGGAGGGDISGLDVMLGGTAQTRQSMRPGSMFVPWMGIGAGGGGEIMGGRPAVQRGGGGTVSLDTFRGGTSMDGDTRVETETEIMQRIADASDEFRAAQTELWAGYWEGLQGFAKDLYVDTVVTMILDSHKSIGEAITELWQGMREQFYQAAVDMVSSWAWAKTKMLVIETLNQKKLLAVKAAGAAAEVPINTAKTAQNEVVAASATHAAAAETFQAHAGIPFVGIAIAIGLIATMMKVMGAFAGGGVVPGGGSGNADDKHVLLSGGEGILTKRAVDANGGRAFVDGLNAMRANAGAGGPGGGVQMTWNIGGGMDAAGMRMDIEREVVPILERLAVQRRLKVA